MRWRPARDVACGPKSWEKEVKHEQDKPLRGNRFAILAPDSEKTGFARQEGK